jgi:UDP-N-acetylglucosamine 4,6-dehydratase/5-epimerase
VSHVVGISTDKACAPVNAYGETKALMEKLFQQADTWSATRFTLVRYGNVLGSRGSVVPLFQKQVSQGKFTLTDPLMTRFWMTLDDAVNLVLTAIGDRAIPRGAIVVPACKASTMMTLLEAVVSCCTGKDLQPSQVKVIGARPGEKQHEALIHKAESLHTLAWQGCGHFHVLPATAEYRGEPFEYTSVDAPRLSVGDIIRMLT